jgi:hypothetical protein
VKPRAQKTKSLMSCCALSVWQVERYALNAVNAIIREIVLQNFLNDFTYIEIKGHDRNALPRKRSR